MLLGILLAFLGVVFSTPTGNATTPEGATRASLAPRRNGYSDLPSDAATYNRREPYNAVPEYVMANDPDIGDDAIVYRRDEIYTALQVGATYVLKQPVREANHVPRPPHSKVTRFYSVLVIPILEITSSMESMLPSIRLQTWGS